MRYLIVLLPFLTVTGCQALTKGEVDVGGEVAIAVTLSENFTECRIIQPDQNVCIAQNGFAPARVCLDSAINYANDRLDNLEAVKNITRTTPLTQPEIDWLAGG